MKTTYKIVADDNYVAPEGPIDNNEAYLNRVMADVFQSYRGQHPAAKSIDEAVTACRERYNECLPPVVEPAAEPEA